MNTVILLGRLVADPRVHVTPDGLHISEVRVVTNDRQDPEFREVVTYRRLAELVGEYTRKGSLVLVSGHLHSDRWTQDGGQRQRIVVVGESVQFLSRPAQQPEEQR